MPHRNAQERLGTQPLDGTDVVPVATRSRVLVARQNATKSTGPRTLTGKARSARNATKHGLTARAVVLPHLEDAADWGAHRGAIIASLTPVGALEAELAERVALLTWRLRRVVRVETAIIAGQLADAETEAVEKARPRDRDLEAELFADDDGWTDTLEVLRTDAENIGARAEHHRRVFLAETEGAAVVAPEDLEVLVDDLAARAELETELVDRAMPGWRDRRWTGRDVLELARVFRPPPDDPHVETAAELLRNAHLAAMLRADDARRRLEDAEKRHARYVAERQVPTVNAGLLERYETHLQRQLASTLTMLRGVRETFTSTC